VGHRKSRSVWSGESLPGVTGCTAPAHEGVSVALVVTFWVGLARALFAAAAVRALTGDAKSDHDGTVEHGMEVQQ
jgi:hypothetical protein